MPTTYPDLRILVGAGATPKTDRRLDRASNGAARGRVLWSAEKRDFRFEHPALSATDRATLEAFHTANLDNSFSFVWPVDGVTYTVLFATDPSYRSIGAGLTSASVELTEA